MKCNPLRWLWGLLPIAALSWWTVNAEHQKIETDLAARVKSLLEMQKLDWAASAFSGRDAVITGDSSDEDDQRKVFEVVRSTWGVRTVADKSRLLDEEKNYILSAALREGKVRLSGFAPSEAARKSIVTAAQAAFPGKEVENALKLARGAPKGEAWMQGVNFGIKQLAGLKAGKADLEGLSLSVEGEAPDQNIYRSVKSALSSGLPKDVRLKSEKLAAPLAKPYVWSARGAGNQLVLAGHVPSDSQREQLLGAARRLFPRLTVVDRMTLASGEPRDWTRATSTALAEIVALETPVAEITDATVTIAGVAPDEGYLGGIRQALRRDMPSTFRLVDQLKFKLPAIKPVSPFTTSLELQPQSVIATGYVPNEAGKKALLDAIAARLPNRRVEDRLQIADGAPEGWVQCAQAGVLGLGRLGNGRLQLVDRALTVQGATDQEALNAELPGAVRTAAGTACTPDVRIAFTAAPEPSLTWLAKFANREIVLSGEVPDAATKSNLVASAGRLFPATRIIDQMTVAQVAPQRWPGVAEKGLELLSKLHSGEARIERSSLSITGEAHEPAVIGVIRSELAQSLAKGYSGRDQIAVRTASAIAAEQEAARRADEEARRRAEEEARRQAQAAAAARAQAEAQRCQTSLAAVVKDGVINFKRASADIENDSVSTLDRLAKIAVSCPDARIEVGGHTDAEGVPERNQRLSERRAIAVLDYLKRSGVDGARLTAVGYGEAKPVADNATAEGRARNRRIEFTVKAQ